ncbi:MAG: hypothetical protein HYU29_01425 [Chloroflexi bacterium]|nr:hypothetical protein [Chloroflexota bacterium]
MKSLERDVSRRLLLVGTAAGALAWLVRARAQPLGAQEKAVPIAAVKVSRVPQDPTDTLWGDAVGATIALNPQNLFLPRLREAGAKAIEVRAVYDEERVGLLLEWKDAHRDADLGTVLSYRDAVAVMFPEDPSLPIPAFTMGQAGNGVTIYHWKSDWQFGPLYDVDEAYPNMHADWYPFSGVESGMIPEARDYLVRGRKEYLTAAAAGNALADPQVQEKVGPVQKMRAEGFGTLEPHPDQDAQGRGLWQGGGWRIAFSVPRRQARFAFKEGVVVPLAFAVWDGSRHERNGQKAYSVWFDMRIGPAVKAPEAGGLAVPLLTGLGALGLAALAGLLSLRFWRSKQKSSG